MAAAAAPWQETASAFRSSLNSKIPPEWVLPAASIPPAASQPCITGTYLHRFLTPTEVSITETPAHTLLSQLRAGAVTSVAVTSAFCHRSALAHQFLNCLLEMDYARALAAAQELDRRLAAGEGPAGALHGLPVSLKDQFVLDGLETTMGYVAWVGNKVGGRDLKEESELVGILRREGAVLFCKSSVPQSLMTGETVNRLVGVCENPLDRRLTPGGSSGGEGALLAAKGSPLGVGTDIGGSIRIPSTYCGLYGLKPSSGRFPYMGMLNSMEGQSELPSVLGPISTSLSALEIFTSAVLSQAPWRRDPLCVRIPYTPYTPPASLKIGVLEHNGYVTLGPTAVRGMSALKSHLSAAGHSVIAWTPPAAAAHTRSLAITGRLFAADGGRDIHSVLAQSGEPVVPQIAEFVPVPARDQVSITDWFDIMLERRRFREASEAYWELTGVDVLLAPSGPTPAPEFGGYREHGYTSVYNNLDWPALVMPLTKAQSGETYPDGFEPVSAKDREVFELWHPEKFVGMPVGVQVVGRRHEEEKVLAVAKVVDAIIEAAGLRG